MTDESCIQVEKLLSKSVNAKIIDFGHKEKGFGERIEVHIKRIDKPGASFELFFNQDELKELGNLIGNFLSDLNEKK